MEIEKDELRIRPRNDADVREVVGWVEDAAGLYLFSGSRLAWPLTADQLQSMATIEGLSAWAIVSSTGDLVAHFDLTIDGVVARLCRVIVNPALRGRGFATPVAGFAVREAQRLGAEVVRLNVISTNEPAIRAYRRAGFQAVPRDAGSADMTVMERQA